MKAMNVRIMGDIKTSYKRMGQIKVVDLYTGQTVTHIDVDELQAMLELERSTHWYTGDGDDEMLILEANDMRRIFEDYKYHWMGSDSDRVSTLSCLLDEILEVTSESVDVLSADDEIDPGYMDIYLKDIEETLKGLKADLMGKLRVFNQ